MLKRILAIWFGLVIISAGVRSLIHHPFGRNVVKSFGAPVGLVLVTLGGIYLLVYGVGGRKLIDRISPWAKKQDNPEKTAEESSPADQSPIVPSQLGVVHVNFEPADILGEPHIIGDSVGRVERSTDLRALAETGDWLQVETPSGVKGWISKRWVAQCIESK